jgi:acyl carrier protein
MSTTYLNRTIKCVRKVCVFDDDVPVFPVTTLEELGIDSLGQTELEFELGKEFGLGKAGALELTAGATVGDLARLVGRAVNNESDRNPQNGLRPV